MYQSIIVQYQEKFIESIEHFKGELNKVRTGRANPSLLESIQVEAYGSMTPLNQVASVNVPEPRLIVVQPWDKGVMESIETAIRNSDLGLNPSNDGQVIRLNIPPLTQERREQLVKQINGKAEEARISVRNIREDIWQEIQDTEKKGDISEDDKFKAKEKLQEVIDNHNKTIEALREKKEGEVMTV